MGRAYVMRGTWIFAYNSPSVISDVVKCLGPYSPYFILLSQIRIGLMSLQAYRLFDLEEKKHFHIISAL